MKVRSSIISRMRSRGFNTPARFLPVLVTLVMLFVILLKISNRRKSMSLPNSIGIQVFDHLRKQWFSVKQSMYITAQAAHETANFTSDVFKHSNNCFGFKYTGHELETGDYHGYGQYASLDDCIARYAYYYIKKRYPGTFASVSEFVKTLKQNKYFEAPEEEYLRGVKYFMNVYFPEEISGAGGTW